METTEPETSILITSDHANLKDLSAGAHTHNPVPSVVSGPPAQYCELLNSILDVNPCSRFLFE